MNELHLFAGIGGGILGGILLGHTCVCAVEIEPYCRKVLLQRQRDGMLPKFPVWDDIKTFDGTPWRGKIDIVCGGFPCQDISCAGKRAGITGERSGLWSEMARVIREIRPVYAFVENSPMLVSRGLTRVIADFTEMGYDAKWGIVGAADAIWLAGNPTADHERYRLWVIAEISNSHRERKLQPKGRIKNKRGRISNSSKSICYSTVERLQDWAYKKVFESTKNKEFKRSGWWSAEPNVGRVATRIPARFHRIRAIGNAQVPIVAALAWETLIND